MRRPCSIGRVIGPESSLSAMISSASFHVNILALELYALYVSAPRAATGMEEEPKLSRAQILVRLPVNL